MATYEIKKKWKGIIHTFLILNWFLIESRSKVNIFANKWPIGEHHLCSTVEGYSVDKNALISTYSLFRTWETPRCQYSVAVSTTTHREKKTFQKWISETHYQNNHSDKRLSWTSQKVELQLDKQWMTKVAWPSSWQSWNFNWGSLRSTA